MSTPPRDFRGWLKRAFDEGEEGKGKGGAPVWGKERAEKNGFDSTQLHLIASADSQLRAHQPSLIFTIIG
jgi:hypothetical protein